MKENNRINGTSPTPWWQPSREVAAAKVVEAEVVKAKVVVVVATMQLELVHIENKV